MVGRLSIGACCVLALLCARAVFAQNDTTPSPTASATNSITQTLVKQGVNACGERVNQVTNFLSGTAPSGAFLFMPPAPADQNLASLSMEINAPDSLAYASASFAPGQAKGCAAVYDAISWWPMKCSELATKHYMGKAQGGMLKEKILVIELDKASRVFLMPAGNNGCVSIKKEVLIQ